MEGELMKTTMILGAALVGLAAAAGSWTLATAAHARQNPYAQQHAGVDDPLLKHLTAGQIRGLQNAAGLGLAKPAELHGMPGPKHVLELADDLDLTDEQRAQTQGAYERMRERALTLGEAVLVAERRVGGFMQERPSAIEGEVASALDEAVEAWRALARVHIEAHAEMMTILTDEQVERYSALRGYTEAGDN
jgi:Spy/CpxP family protein refolding chaperone